LLRPKKFTSSAACAADGIDGANGILGADGIEGQGEDP
jgi:hypothetical protein